MDWRTVTFDWNRARAFLVTAEEGSLSAASRALGLTQPTLGRQVAALERDLGVILFERAGRSLVLTHSGLELLEHVRSMGEAASRVSLAASGRAEAIEGTVCITASDVLSVYVLPPVLGQIRDVAPGIQIEVVASNALSDLTRREADIALRHVPATQPDLIAKRVRESTAHLYAASTYLDLHGRPAEAADLTDAVFIGFGRSERLMSGLNALGVPVTGRNFKLTSESGLVAWELVRQGFGIGVMVKEVASLTPGIERVLPELAPIPVPLWLTTHRELHTSRRIRLVFDLLEEALT